MQKIELTPEIRIDLLKKILNETKMRILDSEIVLRKLNRMKIGSKSDQALTMTQNAIRAIESEHLTLMEKLDIVQDELVEAHKL